MKVLILFTAAWLMAAGTSHAQGVQTGTIRGLVTDQQGLPVAGAAVAVTSPELQGSREAHTDAQGLYTLAALPAGTYQLKFQLAGFAAITTTSVVPLGLTVEVNPVL